LEGIITVVGVWVKHGISVLGYPGVVAMMGIESACIPLPSEIILPFSGYLVAENVFNVHLASLSGALGCAVGSAVAYYAGMKGGRPFLERYGKYLLVRKRDIDRADHWFDKYGESVVFFSRLLPVVRTFISFPAGVSQMNFGRFLFYSFIGSVPWCYFLVYVGMKVGQNLDVLRPYFHKADAAIGVIVALGIVVFIYHHLRPEPA
jgi:membrane protein DedA with SNARE-associated domain